MKTFCESLREHTIKIKKKMLPLTNEEYKSYLNKKN